MPIVDKPDQIWSTILVMIKNISQAKAELSSLIARVQRGEEILIGKAGTPVAKLVPYKGVTAPRKSGSLKGKIRIREDFDTLPPEVAKAFGLSNK